MALPRKSYTLKDETELVTPGGIILPKTAGVIPENVVREKKPAEAASGQDETWLKAAQILGETVLAIKGTEKAAWTAVKILSSVKGILTKQLSLFEDFFAAQRDAKQDQEFAAGKEVPGFNINDVLGDEDGGKLDFIERFFKGVVTTLGILFAFLLTFLHDKVLEALGRISLFLGPISKVAESIFLAVGRFGAALGRVSVAMAEIGGKVGRFSKFTGKLASIFGRISELALGAMNTAGRLLRPVIGLMRWLGALVVLFDFIEGMLTGIAEGGNIYTAIREGLLNVIIGFANIPKILGGLILDLLGLDHLKPAFEEWSDSFVNGLVSILRGMVDFIVQLGQAAMESAKSTARDLLESFGFDKVAKASFLAPSADITAGGSLVTASGKAVKAGPTSSLTEKFAKTPEAAAALTNAITVPTIAAGKKDTSTILEKGIKAAASLSAPIVVLPKGGADAPNVNANRTNVYSTPIVPLNTRSQEPVLNRISDVTFAFRG